MFTKEDYKHYFAGFHILSVTHFFQIRAGVSVRYSHGHSDREKRSQWSLRNLTFQIYKVMNRILNINMKMIKASQLN